MKNFKKITALCMTSALMLSATAFANAENDIMLISENPENPVYLNVAGINVENANIYKDGETSMIPLRKTLESLGYTIDWKDDTQTVTMSKGAHYAELDTDDKLFAFGRMAHQPIDDKFEIIDGTTYVERDFVENLVGIGTYEDEQTVYVSYLNNVTVTEIDEAGFICVNDPSRGDIVDVNGNVVSETNVRLAVSEDTVVLCGDEKYDVKEIKKGDNLYVMYSPMMTMSLPPQTFAQKIIVIK